jgi:hypothetical protein
MSKVEARHAVEYSREFLRQRLIDSGLIFSESSRAESGEKARGEAAR